MPGFPWNAGHFFGRSSDGGLASLERIRRKEVRQNGVADPIRKTRSGRHRGIPGLKIETWGTQFSISSSNRSLPGLVAHHRERGLVGVARVGKADLCLGLRQLRLGQIDDAAEAYLVSRLGQFERSIGLVEKLLGDADALESDLRVEDRGADVAGNDVAQIANLLLGGLGVEVGFPGAGGIFE